MPYKITSWNGDTGQAETLLLAREEVEAMAKDYAETGDQLVWGKETLAVLYVDWEPTDCWWQIEEG